jgi:hypothetical protein
MLFEPFFLFLSCIDNYAFRGLLNGYWESSIRPQIMLEKVISRFRFEKGTLHKTGLSIYMYPLLSYVELRSNQHTNELNSSNKRL